MCGQSNMGVPPSQVTISKEEIAAAANPLVRHINVQTEWSPKKREAIVNGSWVVCSPQTVDATSFTAVGYFFGRKLLKELDVEPPVSSISRTQCQETFSCVRQIDV
ncbi:MAG: hypothetical protein WCP55_25070 [Lentisphaerota bacterium]